MKKDTAKTSAFDIKISRKHRAIMQEIETINDKQHELLSQSSTPQIRRELFENASRLSDLRQEALALVPFDSVEFEKYAAHLFQSTLATIVNDSVLSSCSINFSSMTTEQKQTFGTRLYQKLAQKYGAKNYKDLTFDIVEADYYGGCYLNDKISINTKEAVNFTDFISNFIHEFSHFVYDKLPHKSPLNAQLINISQEHYIMDNAVNHDRYKNQPFEKPSYKIMDYFKEHDFVSMLVTTIKTKHSSFVHE